jgi:hypothetical protein
MGEGRGVYRVLVGRTEGKRPLRTPRRRWDNNMKMDLRENRDPGGELDSAGSEWDPVTGFCEHCNEPSGSVKKEGYLITSRVTISFSNNILHHGLIK